MNKYEVTLLEEIRYIIEVEADSPEEAEQIAVKGHTFGTIDFITDTAGIIDVEVAEL